MNESDLLNIVSQSMPAGITAKAAALKLDCKAVQISQKLGALYFRDKLNRIASPHRNNEYTYTMKPDVGVKASPLFTPRIARPMINDPRLKAAERLGERIDRIAASEVV